MKSQKDAVYRHRAEGSVFNNLTSDIQYDRDAIDAMKRLPRDKQNKAVDYINADTRRKNNRTSGKKTGVKGRIKKYSM